MAIVVSDTGSGDYERPETGLQQAVCSHVVDLGLQDTSFGVKKQVAVCFELAQNMSDGRPFMQSKIYTASLNEKANLRKDLEAWRGRRFTESELAGFDIEKLKGVGCLLNLIETAKNEEVYVNIGTIAKLPSGYPKLEPVDQPVPEWLKKKAEAGKALEKAQDGVRNMSEPPPHTDADMPVDDDSELPF